MSKTGEAGRSGPKVRSDCRIVVEYCDKGGLLLDISSKVGPMYGDNIRQQITESCANLGIENARVTVEDRGALPFVLDARLETAARRADPTLDATLIPEMRKHCTYTSKADRLRRSRLYLPGNEPKFFVNAGLHNPDGMILDLEDSVAHSEKDAARCMVRN
ncbi:citrate lyase acyl carrier protein, partial [bacterium]|nr:citrate lyase acyl carrier protein [bacterium]